MADGIEALIKKYGGTWEGGRPKAEEWETWDFSKLFEGAEFPGEPVFLTPEEAKEWGFDLETGWMLKVTPVEGAKPTWSVVTPEKWEITQFGEYVSPEGEVFKPDEYEALLEASEAQAEFREAYGAVFPERDFEKFMEDLLRLSDIEAIDVSQMPMEEYLYSGIGIEKANLENQLEAMYGEIVKYGRTPETETLLTMLGASPEEINEFFESAAAQFMDIIRTPTPQLEAQIKTVFPGLKVDKMIEFAQQNPDAFTVEILKRGWTADVENLLGMLYPGRDINDFFPDPMEESIEAWSDAPLFPDMDTWDECVHGFPGLIDLWNFFAPAKVGGASIGVACSAFDKYIMRPWEGTVMYLRAEFQYHIFGDRDARDYLIRIRELDKKYGWAGIFSEEVHYAMEDYMASQPFYVRGHVELASWCNPVFWIPIGAGAGAIARFTAKVPVLGRATRWVATGVIGTEKAIVYPVVRPIQLGIGGLERVGQKIGTTAADRLMKEADHLVDFAKLTTMTDDQILDGLITDNWMTRMVRFGAKIPGVRTGIEKGLGWRILVERNSMAVESIVGRGAILHNYFARLGVNARQPIIYSLRATIKNPVKYFGFNEHAFSQTMKNRLLTKYAGEANAGTFEHIFTHPEMYKWEGLGKTIEMITEQGQRIQVDAGLKYVIEFQRINEQVLALLKAEGVAPKHIIDDWVHRVVLREGRRLRRGGAIGGLKPYERVREFETMAEGIEWFMKHKELGAHYASNPEASIAEYVEQAFRRISDERFVKYVAGFEEIAGQRPLQRLLEQFPELAQQAILRAEEFADTRYFTNAINRAIRGEALPEQTLRAIERRFPDLGRQFRALSEVPAVTETELRAIIKQNQQLVDDLTARLRKAEAVDIDAIKRRAVAESRAGIPPEHKLEEAFGIMEYEDRLAFRSTLESQVDDVERMLAEHQMELAYFEEELAGSAAAPYVQVLARSGWYKGEIRYLTANQYRILTGAKWVTQRAEVEGRIVTRRILQGGKEPTAGMMTPEGKVRWEYALDAIATEKGYASGEAFKEAIERALELQTKIRDYQILMGIGTERSNQIRRMLNILERVETKPQFAMKPKPEFAPPPAAEAMPELTPMPQYAQDELFIQAGKGAPGLSSTPQGLVYRNPAGEPVAVVTLFPEGEFVRIGAVVMRAEGLLRGRAAREILAALEKIPNLKLPPTIEMSPQGYAIAQKFMKRRGLEVPKAEPGMPEAGIQKDLFGYEAPHFPAGRGRVTQISMEDYQKLIEYWKKAGLPEEDLPIAIKPKVEGVAGLEAETSFKQIKYEIPPARSAAERIAALKELRAEVKSMMETRRIDYLRAKTDRAFRMEQIKQPNIGEGYIMQPFAGGKIYSEEFIDAFNKFFGYDKGVGVLKVTSDTAGILRITKAALDFSFHAIQGLPTWGLAHAMLLSNPEMGLKMMGAWYRNYAIAIASFFNEGLLARIIDSKLPISMSRIQYGGSSRAIMLFQEYEMAGLGKAFERATQRLPWTPYQRAERAWFAAGELVRNDFWEILYPIARRSNQEFQLARSLDLITGIADSRMMGVPLTVRQIEQSFMWFAPNYTRACLTVLADIFRGGMTGAMARRAIGGMVSAGIFYYSAAQYSASLLSGRTPEQAMMDVLNGLCVYKDPVTGEWEWRPSARFMTMKIGNYYMGFGGFWYGLMRLGGNISECVRQVGDKDIIDLFAIFRHGSFNKQDNPFIYWWYSRSSPFFGSIFEMSTGKDFLGYPIEGWEEYAKYIGTRFEPIWMEQGLNWLVPGLARENEIPEGAARAAVVPAELLGLRTFPESTWVIFYDAATDYIKRLPVDILSEYFDEDELRKILDLQEKGDLRYEHLPEALKMRLIVLYPELEELYLKAQTDSSMRNHPTWQAWEDAQDRNRTQYYERGDQLIDQLLALVVDTRELREKWGDAGLNYGAHLDEIEQSGVYDIVYEYLEKKRAEGYKYDWDMNLALSEYIVIMFSEYVDSKGDIDWDAKDAAVDAWIAKWGESWYELIRQMYADNKLQEGLHPILVRLSEDKDKLGRTYWRLPYKPIIEMDAADAAAGDIPAEYLDLWEEYQGLTTEAQKEAFIARHPEMARDFRAEYRLENPEIDAMLALWGYGGRLQSMEAYNLVVKWGQELGIPLEQMGLGLPPQSLIEDYFGYNEIALKFGGNSAESKLWRLEHPNFTNWAMEEWGWEGTSEYKGMDYYKLEIEWKEQDAEYDALETTAEREAYLAGNLEYHRSRRYRDALDLECPEDLIEDYIDYYVNPDIKKPDDWQYPYYFEDDWWLMEHPDLVEFMVDAGIWQEPDFSKVPTREVWALYKKYLALPRDTKLRLCFRAEHKELDMWLVFALGYTPVGDRCSS